MHLVRFLGRTSDRQSLCIALLHISLNLPRPNVLETQNSPRHVAADPIYHCGRGKDHSRLASARPRKYLRTHPKTSGAGGRLWVGSASASPFDLEPPNAEAQRIHPTERPLIVAEGDAAGGVRCGARLGVKTLAASLPSHDRNGRSVAPHSDGSPRPSLDR